MSKIEELSKVIQRIERLTKDDGYGAITRARGIEGEYRARAVAIEIKAPGYQHELKPIDKDAAEKLKVQFIDQYQAEGRRKATEALSEVRREIIRLRLEFPLLVAAASAEAYQIAQDLEREIAERRAET